VPDAICIRPDIRAQHRSDALIADLARRQHGVVTREQLLDLGLGRRAIGHRRERLRLHVVHRGVYAVGHTVLTREGRWMAAVLATDGVASHHMAGAIWELRASNVVEVTSAAALRRPGIRIHRSVLPADEVTVERAIPVTTVARTLVDLAASLPPWQLERALNEAENRRLGGPLSVPDLLERYPRRAGVPALRAILKRGADISRSELEARFFEFVAERDLPAPQRNGQIQVRGEWLECDCVWRRERVVVELDGRRFHSTALAFERDRTRDRRLSAAGWTVIRITWSQLTAERDALEADLRAVLRHRG
jgi:very-short-patch-repair endonuclease/predicted transcriptional regulator of viral defense system